MDPSRWPCISCATPSEVIDNQDASFLPTSIQLTSKLDYHRILSLPADFFLSGYFKGKRDAEAKLMQTFPSGGVALRPGFIYGTRQVGPLGIPLQAVGARSACCF